MEPAPRDTESRSSSDCSCTSRHAPGLAELAIRGLDLVLTKKSQEIPVPASAVVVHKGQDEQGTPPSPDASGRRASSATQEMPDDVGLPTCSDAGRQCTFEEEIVSRLEGLSAPDTPFCRGALGAISARGLDHTGLVQEFLSAASEQFQACGTPARHGSVSVLSHERACTPDSVGGCLRPNLRRHARSPVPLCSVRARSVAGPGSFVDV